jgi:2-polyprenyl-3-methyl-5-hydroxy-6-metoxy-1,4-benzoquinol methylase
MEGSAPQEFSTEVREHYEELPYPYRRIEDEGKQFHGGDGFGPEALNHIAWAGRRDLRKGGRVLIAGNGTGDASVQWGESLYGSDAEIIAIDISTTSMELAKARLEKRQLHNVTLKHLSIMDLPGAGLGTFDVIECTGVLHHLPDPPAGLRALGSVLKDDGVMSLMVYAQYGRMPIYMVQDLLRRLMKPGMTRAEKLELARGFLNHVPNTHWLTVKNEEFIDDLSVPDGSGIYDLLLHSTDRAYTVPELYDWVEGAGLQVAGLFSDFTDDSIYRPQHYTQDATMLAAFAGKSEKELFAIGELLHGTMTKHNFYVSKQPLQQAALEDDMVLSYGLMQTIFAGFVQTLIPLLQQVNIGERVACATRPSRHAPPTLVTKRPSTIVLLQLINNARTVGEIISEAARLSKYSRHDVRKDLELLYKEFRARLMVNLQHQSVPAYPTVQQMFQRLQSIGVVA